MAKKKTDVVWRYIAPNFKNESPLFLLTNIKISAIITPPSFMSIYILYIDNSSVHW